MTEDRARVERVTDAIWNAHVTIGYDSAGEIARTAIAAMEAGTERPEAVPTVRVKVALVVDEEGRWGAAGGHLAGPGDVWQWLAIKDNVCGERRNCLFIEADVPLPAAPAVIKGEVTEG